MTNPFDIESAPTTEPEGIIVGVYAAWRKLLDYPATEYTLSYTLTPRDGGSAVSIDGTFDVGAQEWRFVASSSVTSGWTSGDYRWDLNLTRTSDGEVACIATGAIVVFATTDDRRTHAEVMVQKIESLLSGRADSDIESYSIKSRSLTKMGVKELTEWRDYYRAEIRRTGGSVTSAARPSKNAVRVRWR